MAREAFQSPLLRNTEGELHECMVTLESSIAPDMRDSMDALREILEEKLNAHHNNLGLLDAREPCRKEKGMCGAKTVEEGGGTHFQNPLRTAASPELEPERKKKRNKSKKKPERQTTYPKTTWNNLARSRHALSTTFLDLTMTATMTERHCS